MFILSKITIYIIHFIHIHICYSIEVIKKAPIESGPLSIITKYNYFTIPICCKKA